HDPNREVRYNAGLCMASLMKYSNKFDQLCRDLNNLLIKQPKLDVAIQASILDALSNILLEVGNKIKSDILDDIINTLKSELCVSSDDSIRVSAANCLGKLTYCLDEKQIETLLVNYCLGKKKNILIFVFIY